MLSNHVPDKESMTGTCQEIVINGKATLYGKYIPDLWSIESERFIVTGINVVEEGFLTSSDTIDYIFTAEGFRVKY